MSTPTPAGHTNPIAALLDVLQLSDSEARTSEDIFTGVSHSMPSGRVYGGQVLAQTIVAAQRTIPDARPVHSMHGYFLRPGDATRGITFAVDRIHDGRSFSTRRTQAYQDALPIFSMIASFQDEDSGVEHQESPPEGLPGPEDLPTEDELFQDVPPHRRRLVTDRPVEARHIPSPLYLRVDGEHVPRQAVWVRTRGPLPDDPAIHRAALAYISDLSIGEPVLRAHGISWSTPGLKVASLDHAMWWHRPARADEWTLYVQESPSARGGRGLSLGRMFSRDGTHIATVAQEITIRVPDAR